MAAKKFKVKGIEVELWKTSFRLPGMHQVFWPTHVTEETVTEFVEAVYEAVKTQAAVEGKRKVVDDVTARVKELIGG